MARPEDTEIIDRFLEFYRTYYADEIGQLAQAYPNDRKSLSVDWEDLYRFDRDIAEDFLAQPGQMRDYAEEALRLYDLPADVKLGGAHVRLVNLAESTEIREIREQHHGRLIAVQGTVNKATSVRPKIQQAAFECQRCGTLSHVPQAGGNFQEPHECEGCERQGPFEINFDQSEFVDAQKLRVQESPEGLRGGQTPEAIDINIEDDITGRVTAGDHVRVTGVLHLEQQGNQQEKSLLFDQYMEGVSVEMEDEEFEEMDITESDKQEIVRLAEDPEIYEKMVESMAPSIYGYETHKKAIIFQLFSGVTKHLPDDSRIRGDLHLLLIGDPGTGKCLDGDTTVLLSDGTEQPIREIVESNLNDPKPVDDGVWDEVDIQLPSLTRTGDIRIRGATKVWKRKAPDRMYRIETASGRELEVTPSHPLFVEDGSGWEPVRAESLSVGDAVAVSSQLAADGGAIGSEQCQRFGEPFPEPITTIEAVTSKKEWVYDLEVEGTHNYLSNGVISHNSQLLQYVKNIAPRSVYTSGKGSSAAGLTATAVRDEFGEGDQWSLEAGALVLADKGIAAIDELDKMDSGDRSAMHEALEQQSISVAKAGINATLKSRCSLLGAANPKYGRFDEYEAISEQIDLEPALISRFDLIFTITDNPDEEEDRRLARHILQTNYAGELHTHRQQVATSNISQEEVDSQTEDVEPIIGPDLFRKYVAYAKRTCYPTMTEGARDRIEEFYVDLRVQGEGEDAPVPVTARKLEALIRLAEASARVRLSDTVEEEDAERVIDIVRKSLEDVGMDPETNELDADMIEAGTSKSQRDRIKSIKGIIDELQEEYEDGAPYDEVIDMAQENGTDRDKAEHEIEKLKERGEVYEPRQGHLRTT